MSIVMGLAWVHTNSFSDSTFGSLSKKEHHEIPWHLQLIMTCCKSFLDLTTLKKKEEKTCKILYAMRIWMTI